MDVLPTAVYLSGGALPADSVIDGKNIWPVLSGNSQESPHEGLYYFGGNTLEAVRSGPWKLAIAPQEEAGIKERGVLMVPASREAPRLYHLDHDIGETTDVAAQNPVIVKRLLELVTRMDADLGVKSKGPGVRAPGRVKDPKALLLRSGIEYE